MPRNLYDVVRRIQIDREDYTPHNRLRYLEFAISAYQNLQLQSEPKVSVHYFTVNDVGVAALPPDFEFYTKVKVIICGVAYTLTVNPDITFPRIVCGVDTPLELEGTCGSNPNLQLFGNAGFAWVSHFRAGQYVGESYSLGGGWNQFGYFRIDWAKRNIVMQGVPSNALYVMEYVSNGSDGGATLISQNAFEPIRNYVHWEISRHDRTISLSEKQYAEANYLKAYNQYRDIADAITIDEFMDKMYGGFTPSIKGVSLYGNVP